LVHLEIDVRVRDAAVVDLRKEDFRIIDAGKTRPVLAFGHEEVPLDVILLLDMRPNMLHIIERLADATELALRELHQGDRVAVAVLSNTCQANLLSDFTSDFRLIQEELRGQLREQRAQTEPWDCQIIKGLALTSKYFDTKTEGNRRRAIIAISHDRG